MPLQGLTQSLESLRAGHYHALTGAADAVHASLPTAPMRATPLENTTTPQQAAHADPGDSVVGIEPCRDGQAPGGTWPGYLPIAFPGICIPVIKPPLI